MSYHYKYFKSLTLYQMFRLRAIFDYSSLSASDNDQEPFDDADTTSLTNMVPQYTWKDVWNNFVLITCGTGHIMSRTSNILHVLGSVTALCCVDKKGILSWPNPTSEKVFFLHNTEEDSDSSRYFFNSKSYAHLSNLIHISV